MTPQASAAYQNIKQLYQCSFYIYLFVNRFGRVMEMYYIGGTILIFPYIFQ